MESTLNAIDPLQRFQDEGYKNWMKTTLALDHLKKRLAKFLENETETFHQTLHNKIKLDGEECSNNCDFKKWVPKVNQKPHLDCKVCVPWRDEIWNNHTCKGLVYWNNSTPKLWPRKKWEVAKVYMPKGNKAQQFGKEFDIAALLNFMSFCQHFKQHVSKNILTEVISVRNKVMHSADFSVTVKELDNFLQKIKALGYALEKRVPEFKNLSMRMSELQKLDFSMILHEQSSIEIEMTSHAAGLEPIIHLNAKNVLDMEWEMMKEKMEYILKLNEAGSEDKLTSEELQHVRMFLERNTDLRVRLLPQWDRLMQVQEQQGEQINSLTDRVGELEKRTPTLDSDYTTIKMHKNHLLDVARRCGWSEPVFSEIHEATGYRGEVRVNNQLIKGLQVCRSKILAHQDVAKEALQQLSAEIARDQVNEQDNIVQVDQLESATEAGPCFYGSVILALDTKVSPDHGCDTLEKAMESVYKKTASLFGLDSSIPASTYKEQVLQYCQSHGVPPPEEISECDLPSLHLSGEITFYDFEGSKKKKQTQQQAAKEALQGLSKILEEKKVLNENYVGALKELVDACKLERERYDCNDTPERSGERVRWVANQERVKETEVQQRIRHGSGEGRKDGPFFFGSVIVALDTKVSPDDGCDTVEKAMESVYKKIASVFGLDSSASASTYKEQVLQYCQRHGVPPPEEISECDIFSLHLNGEITFYDLEGSKRKKQTQQQAAKAALQGLRNVLEEKKVLNENYVGALKELVDFCKLERERYDYNDTPERSGERVRWVVNQKRGEEMVVKQRIRHDSRDGVQKVQPGCALDTLSERDKMENETDHPSKASVIGIAQNTQPLKNQVCTDTCVTMETKATPTIPEDDGPFYGCVTVTVKKELKTDEASSHEEAIQAAYCSLLKDLSLGPAAATGEEKKLVLEFFTRTKCQPPEEQKITINDKHYCSLKIDGNLTFCSPVGAPKKQRAEQLAAKEALNHLKGLLGGMSTKLPEENCKGQLQELIAQYRSDDPPQYSVTERSSSAAGHLCKQKRCKEDGVGSSEKDPKLRQ